MASVVVYFRDPARKPERFEQPGYTWSVKFGDGFVTITDSRERRYITFAFDLVDHVEQIPMARF